MRKCRKPFHATRLGMWGLALSCLGERKFVRGTRKVPVYGNSAEENPPAPREKSNGKICWEIFAWLKESFEHQISRGTQTRTTLRCPCCERLWDFPPLQCGCSACGWWLHVPGFPSAPERWDTNKCTVSHPKPGWCSATPHPGEPCVNLTPRQHKILNLTAPILIIWHFFPVFLQVHG